MPSHAPQPDDERGRVLPFQRHGQARPRVPPRPPEDSPVEGVEKYARSEEPDNYRQRMINNGLAFAFCLRGVRLVAPMALLAVVLLPFAGHAAKAGAGRGSCAQGSVITSLGKLTYDAPGRPDSAARKALASTSLS